PLLQQPQRRRLLRRDQPGRQHVRAHPARQVACAAAIAEKLVPVAAGGEPVAGRRRAAQLIERHGPAALLGTAFRHLVAEPRGGEEEQRHGAGEAADHDALPWGESDLYAAGHTPCLPGANMPFGSSAVLTVSLSRPSAPLLKSKVAATWSIQP